MSFASERLIAPNDVKLTLFPPLIAISPAAVPRDKVWITSDSGRLVSVPDAFTPTMPLPVPERLEMVIAPVEFAIEKAEPLLLPAINLRKSKCKLLVVLLKAQCVSVPLIKFKAD